MTKVVIKLNGNIVFTREYRHEGWWTRRTVTQGTSAIVTKVHTGIFFATITHLTVRLKDGTFLQEVPIDYFSAG